MNTLAPVTFATLLATTTTIAHAQSLGCHDLAAIAPIAQSLVVAAPAFGSNAVRLELPSGLLYEQSFGNFTPTTQVAIASATKTLSAAVLMSLVDGGVLSLDDRVGQWLPEWNTGLKALITLRMCFTHTSGMQQNDPVVMDNAITLRQAAAQIATMPLQYVPGNAFAYGSLSMHVAGAVCEVATGQSWSSLFAQRIAVPLQLSATDYFAFGPTQNPRIDGGARSTLRDYARFTAMLREDGIWNGVQVLTAASVDVMLTAQTVGLPILGTPHPYSAPYGIGIWIDRRDSQGRTLFASGVGAFGFAGWIDRAHDLSGTFAIEYLNQLSYPYLERIFTAVDAALLPAGASCLGVPSPACAATVWMNATLPTTAGNADFALRCDRAPAGMPGAMLLGDPLPSGLPVLDLTAFLGPQIDVVAGLVADPLGRATLAAPLSTVTAGLSFGLQSVWLSPAPCTQLGLQASHGLRLLVLP
jgi:CubicO group peptidase (beta-lactamase class C family)